MSVTIEHPVEDATLPASNPDGLTIDVTGTGPRRTPVFVNGEVTETDAGGRFSCRVTLPLGEQMLVAGLLLGCAKVTCRRRVTVATE